jgi:hypothetical protein
MKRSANFLQNLTIEHLWAITVMVGIIAFLNTHPIRPHDFWWHLAIGRDIVTSGAIPTVDTYSFTRPGMPYLSYHQFWLMEAVLYLVYRAGGPILSILVQTLMIAPAYFLLIWIGWRLTRNWRAAAFGALFAAALGFGNWNVRPQAISYLFGVLILWSIVEYRLSHRKAWLAVIPVVMAFWVNSHGSFPIGLALVGIWGADEGWKILTGRILHKQWAWNRLAAPVVGMLLALAGCLINPRGIGFVGYFSMMAGNTVVQNYIMEWMPPNFDSLEGIIFFAAFLGSAVLMAVSPRRPDFFQIITFLIFAVLGLKYIRGIIWFGLVIAPVVSVHLAALLEAAGVQPPPRPTAATRRLNLIFVSMLSLLAFLSLPWFKQFWPVVPEKRGLIAVETPLAAADFMLDNDLPGQVFHDMAFGSYLMWAAQPDYPVFVDSRIELYPLNIWDDYLIISSGVFDWEARLDQYQINTLMLEPVKQIGLIEQAARSPNWIEVYRDNQAVIFRRVSQP